MSHPNINRTVNIFGPCPHATHLPAPVQLASLTDLPRDVPTTAAFVLPDGFRLNLYNATVPSGPLPWCFQGQGSFSFNWPPSFQSAGSAQQTPRMPSFMPGPNGFYMGSVSFPQAGMNAFPQAAASVAFDGVGAFNVFSNMFNVEDGTRTNNITFTIMGPNTVTVDGIQHDIPPGVWTFDPETRAFRQASAGSRPSRATPRPAGPAPNSTRAAPRPARTAPLEASNVAREARKAAHEAKKVAHDVRRKQKTEQQVKKEQAMVKEEAEKENGEVMEHRAVQAEAVDDKAGKVKVKIEPDVMRSHVPGFWHSDDSVKSSDELSSMYKVQRVRRLEYQ